MLIEGKTPFSRLFERLYWPDGNHASLYSGDKITRGLMGFEMLTGWAWVAYGFGNDIAFINWLVLLLLISIPPTVLAKWRMCVLVTRAEEAERNGISFVQDSLEQNVVDRYIAKNDNNED